MDKNFRQECFPILLDFLMYHESTKNHSPKTVQEYFLDLRMFFRFLKVHKGLAPEEEINTLSIVDINEAFLNTITLSDAFAFLSYLSQERININGKQKDAVGIGPTARARKVASIRSFFRYGKEKAHVLTSNPMTELESPKLRKKLPVYLTEDESVELLDNIEGKNEIRDYAIITLFLNCGLRISELAGLNLPDIQGETIRVLGKGNKERILYLNQACVDSLVEYLKVRPPVDNKKVPALFLSNRLQRISVQTIHVNIKKHLAASGLNPTRYSAHKLRHTAATLMLSNGVDIRTLQELLGHDSLNTTQIYTHIDNDQLRDAAKANPLSHKKAKR
jgi:site-specific recombinase XerD